MFPTPMDLARSINGLNIHRFTSPLILAVPDRSNAMTEIASAQIKGAALCPTSFMATESITIEELVEFGFCSPQRRLIDLIITEPFFVPWPHRVAMNWVIERAIDSCGPPSDRWPHNTGGESSIRMAGTISKA